MALYGVTDADESKPKWAVRGSGVDPQNIFATADGWVLRHYKNAAKTCLLYTSPSPRDKRQYRMPSSA